MSGHSKWSSIKHKKAAKDAKRGKLFTKLIREITVAARLGGADPASNPRLRTAIAAAKAARMPNDNIDRAIKKGSGELEGANYEQVVYEGYGPAGVAIMVDVLTDNRNRTVAEIRSLFSKHNGSLGENNCVSWIFSRCGLVRVDKGNVDEEKLYEIAVEAGAEDISDEGDSFELSMPPENLEEVKDALEKNGIAVLSAEVTRIPKSTVNVRGKEAEQVLKLLEALEDNDDVQSVAANLEIPQEELEQISA